MYYDDDDDSRLPGVAWAGWAGCLSWSCRSEGGWRIYLSVSAARDAADFPRLSLWDGETGNSAGFTTVYHLNITTKLTGWLESRSVTKVLLAQYDGSFFSWT